MSPGNLSSYFRALRPQHILNASHQPPLRLSARPRMLVTASRGASRTSRTYSTKTQSDQNPSALYNIRNPVKAATVVFAAVFSYRAYDYYFPTQNQRLDSPSSNSRDPYTVGAKVEIAGKNHNENIGTVPTGTSKVPYFPKTIWLPRSGSAKDETVSAALPAGIGAVHEEEEYQLMGLGIRTVSFLSIQVYVVGFYVAKGDMGRLQEELVRAYMPRDSSASALVSGEKEDLRKMLVDGKGSEKIWSQVLKDGGVRSAVRVVPTRDTNFGHLRDGWLRGIDARGKGQEYEGLEFKIAVDEFKGMMGGKGSVGKGRVLLLGRGARGDLRIWVEEDAATRVEAEQVPVVAKGSRMSLLGRVNDERVSRLVWMGYLAGQNVASEAARQSVIEGVMNVVERPIGTVETQVV